ncbi:MAG: hypothetical protein ACFFG0_08740 [Candidatus Thorarchaeota archaeon]
MTILWGISHVFPTKNVVKDFGDISQDNKYIITMEWLIEGVALIFIGFLVLSVTFLGGSEDPVSKLVYWLSSIMLFGLAVLSLFTGFKANFIVFKLCPFIFTVSGALILVGSFL